MGFNSRGVGRVHGANENFHHKGRRGGKVGNQGKIFKPDSSGMFRPPVGYSPQIPLNGLPFLSHGNDFGSRKPNYGAFSPKNFKRKFSFKSNEAPALEIDLTRPWVTEEIKKEEIKKEELLETWKLTRDDGDWGKFKAQKMNVQSLYENARVEYIASHPDEALVWKNTPHFKKLYCETCDKSFRTDDDLIIHESEHEICGRDGCTFTAHPKVVSKHIRMQHDSGLFGRIGVLQTTKDIAQWIEERKKRYPTRKLVEEKKAMEEEKINRGERIKDDTSRFNKSFKKRNKSEVKKKFEKKTKTRNRCHRKKKKNPLPLPVEEKNIPTERSGVPAFRGIRNYNKSEPIEKAEKEEEEEEEEKEKDNLDISDDEWEAETQHDFIKPTLNNSLGLLAAAYDSEIESQSKETVIDKEECASDEGSGPEEVATVLRKSPPLEDTKEKEVVQKRKFLDKSTRERKRVKNDFTKNPERNLTLLEKLLKDEIRHERNLILQCVHYVVKKNFFKT